MLGVQGSNWRLPGQVISDRIGAYLAFAVKTRSNKVSFRGHKFEPCSTQCYRPMPMEENHPYNRAFRARETIPWSGRAIITSSVSCVTSQCDFVGASFRPLFWASTVSVCTEMHTSGTPPTPCWSLTTAESLCTHPAWRPKKKNVKSKSQTPGLEHRTRGTAEH